MHRKKLRRQRIERRKIIGRGVDIWSYPTASRKIAGKAAEAWRQSSHLSCVMGEESAAVIALENGETMSK
jgi:hypothetical protein